MEQGDSQLRGAVLKEGEVEVERMATVTFRSPWMLRHVVLTEQGLYLFDLANARQRKSGQRGALVQVIALESINGVLLRHEGKRKHIMVCATFLKDHLFLLHTDEEAQEWRRLTLQAMVSRRKQATLRGGGSSRQSSMRRDELAETAEAVARREQKLRDAESVMNEEINALLHLYLAKRTAVLDELMGRELWAVQELHRQKKEQIEAVIRHRYRAPIEL